MSPTPSAANPGNSADMSGDGILTIGDFGVFIDAFLAGY